MLLNSGGTSDGFNRRLNLAYHHASGVERYDFVVEGYSAGLALRNKLRLEADLAMAGDVNVQFAELAAEGFSSLTVAGMPFGTIS